MNKDLLESTSEETKRDHQLEYHLARLRFGLLDLHLRDAIKEGDGQRLFNTMPYLLLIFNAYKRTKYSYVTLLHLVKVLVLLPEGIAREVVSDRFFNRKGGLGNNIPMDLRMEHMVRLLKTSLKQLGANISEQGAQRIAQSLNHVENILQNASNDCKVQEPSGRHSSKPLHEKVKQTVNDLNAEECFTEIPDREYKSFPGFDRNIFSQVNFGKCLQWIKDRLKRWEAIYE